MKKLLERRTLVISLFVTLIIVLTLVALVPLFISLAVGSGNKVPSLDLSSTKPAEGELDGTWHVVQGTAHNFSSAGFTFDEVLPAERTQTSASTKKVSGQATVTNQVLEQATVNVDMTTLTTDKEVRDQNMKTKLFAVDKYPEATFKLTVPVSLAHLPQDGTAGAIQVEGDLTIKDRTQHITQEFQAVRDGKNLTVAGDIHINREDFDVITPEFIAAKIAPEGLINLRLTFSQ